MKAITSLVAVLGTLALAAASNTPAVPRTPVVTYGLIRDVMGIPLTAEAKAQVRLVRADQPQGQVYALSAVEPNVYLGMNYRLSLEMDSKGPSRAYAAVEGMPMRVVVLKGGEERSLSPLPVWNAPKPGTAQRRDYIIGADDSDNDGLPDDWEYLQMWLNWDAANVPGSLEDFDPNADYDGDGMTNLQEFYAGTNPFEKTDLLAITSIAKVPGSNLLQIKFTTSVDHRYHLVMSETLANPVWSPVATTLAPAVPCAYNVYTGNGHEITVYVDASISGGFFKIACN